MDRSDTAKIVKMLLSALRLTRPIPDDEAMLAGWHLALSDLPYDVCERAATTVLREEKFFPEPATVRALALKEIVKLPDADEAWSLIEKRKRDGVNAIVGWSVPTLDAVNDAIKALGGLWALRNSETPTRDREQFYRLWPDIVKRYQRNAQIVGTPVCEFTAAKNQLAALEDRGMGLVDYETQQPKPIPAGIVKREDLP